VWIDAPIAFGASAAYVDGLVDKNESEASVTRTIHRVSLLAFLAAAAAFGACSLNPQPIPPGFSDTDAATTASPSLDAATKPNTGDSGAGIEAGSPPPFDDSDAGPSSDAGVDASSDASDASADAPIDAPSDG
jgi:hypothetical protein